MATTIPQLIFFTELETDDLAALIARPGLVQTLAAQQYGVAMGMLDWSPRRAEIVRLLNQAGIPITAWLLLPRDAGYWFNIENYPQAVSLYRAFRNWAIDEGLAFHAVGLDLEPSPQHRSGLRQAKPLAIYGALMAARNNALFPAAYEAYHDLVAEIRSDGYVVHTYQYPVVIDDRRAATTLIQRTLNVVELLADVEVLLCYSSNLASTSLHSDLGGALIVEYGVYADSIGIGSTGGGRDNGPPARPLVWPAFARDLRLAAAYTDSIHIFSLEGCVEQGYLERLPDFDWSAPVHIAVRHRVAARAIRMMIGMVLWWSRFGTAVLGWLGWVVTGVILLRRLLKRLRRN
jgi:hypothetical protein